MQVLFDFIVSHPVALAVALVIVGVISWHTWVHRIRPLLIPKSDIDRMADALIAEHGSRAEEIASMEEDRAWRYSNTLKQGIWRRVRRELQRRYEAGEWH
ncbi:MAG: hypothetical protein RIC24_17740 [Hyphomicrobiales bacterium]|jgi:hypothetical protein